MAKLVAELASGKTVVKEIAEGKKFVIGRRRESDLVIGDARASRTHAVIAGKGGRYVLKDNNSSNGTAVNGDRIDNVELSDGDQIVIAGISMTFRVDGEAPAQVQEAIDSLKQQMLADLESGPLPDLPEDASPTPVPAASPEREAAAAAPSEPGRAEAPKAAADAVTSGQAVALGEELEELEEIGSGGDAAPKTQVDQIAAELTAELGEDLEELGPEGDGEITATALAVAAEAVAAEPVEDLGEDLAELAEELGEALEDMAGELLETAEPVVGSALAGKETVVDDGPTGSSEGPSPAPGRELAEADSIAASLAEELGEELEELEELSPDQEASGVAADAAVDAGENVEDAPPEAGADDTPAPRGVAPIIELGPEVDGEPDAELDDEVRPVAAVIELEPEVDEEPADAGRPVGPVIELEPEGDEKPAGPVIELEPEAGEEAGVAAEEGAPPSEELAAEEVTIDSTLADELGEDLEELIGEEAVEEPEAGVVGGLEEIAEAPEDDEVDVLAALERDAEEAAAVGVGAAVAAAGVGAVDTPAPEELQAVVDSATQDAPAPKKSGKSSRAEKAKGSSRRGSRRMSQRSTRREGIAGGESSSDTKAVKVIAVVVMAICGLGILLLIGKILANLGAQPQTRVIRQENPYVNALSEADRLITQAHKAMREGRYTEAVSCYERAYDNYEKASGQYSGDGYGYLEQKKADINGWLRDARERVFIEEMRRSRGGG